MSIKQLIIDMSKEARAEFRKLLDELDAIPEQEVRAPEAPTAEEAPAPKTSKKAVEEKVEDAVEAKADTENETPES